MQNIGLVSDFFTNPLKPIFLEYVQTLLNVNFGVYSMITVLMFVDLPFEDGKLE
jgi:hypothetical protein